MSDAQDETRGFKINDKRAFTPDGERRSEVPGEDPLSRSAAAPSTSQIESKPAARTASEPEPRSATHSPFGPPPQVQFLDLLSLLAAQVTRTLGEGRDASDGDEEDLRGAQMMISLIEVLKEKTNGNLSDEEQRALDQVLYELRMAFMVKAKVIKT